MTANYFSLLDISIVRGRTFTDAEMASPTMTAMIVTESTAQRLWPNQDPVSQRLVLGTLEGGEQTVDIVEAVSERQPSRGGQRFS